MFFVDKKIFIISPQSWDSNKISKHHYAATLAKRGAFIFFINPIMHGFKHAMKIEHLNEHLKIITFTIPLPKIIKFKLKSVFDIFMVNHFKYLIKSIGLPDILWNFDNKTYFQYEDLFKQSYRIFHPVDAFVKDDKRNHNELYDIVFSVSKDILESVPHNKKYFINHGLQEEFIKNVSYKKQDDPKKEKINITYMGNISIPFLNRAAFISLIYKFRNIEFRILGKEDKSCSFQKQLSEFPNVTFYGRLSGNDLFTKLFDGDIMLICYKKNKFYHADNSHKILEYLSTGNPIISSPLSVYKEYPDIISFFDFEEDDFLEKFQLILNDYEKLNTIENRIKRINLALDNTYQKQIERIEKIIQ